MKDTKAPVVGYRLQLRRPIYNYLLFIEYETVKNDKKITNGSNKVSIRVCILVKRYNDLCYI